MPRTSSASLSAAPRASTASLDDARWAAFVARDAAFDGQFYVAVETTGIYCRPSCAARRPKRAHVRFYDTAAEAGTGRLQALQALQADRAVAPPATSRQGERSLPPDRDG